MTFIVRGFCELWRGSETKKEGCELLDFCSGLWFTVSVRHFEQEVSRSSDVIERFEVFSFGGEIDPTVIFNLISR